MSRSNEADDAAAADGRHHDDDDDAAAEHDRQRDFARVPSVGDPLGRDPFAPPLEPCECYCLHCQRTFMSDGIWFQRIVGRKGKSPQHDGFWMCPTPNCDGAGFTFDIFPTDPDHPANDGWYDDDGGEDDDFDDDDNDDGLAEHSEGGAGVPPEGAVPDAAQEWDPSERKYAALDEHFGDADDDLIEGDEWKLGPHDPDAPRAPLHWPPEARRQWEEEQRRYDEPDRRPRELDWSDRPEEESTRDEDIPF